MKSSILQVFFETARDKADQPALRHKVDGSWHQISWSEYNLLVQRAARGFIRLGLQPGQVVAVVGRNCPEWLIGHLAVMAAGGVSTSLYPTSTAEQSGYVVQHCEASIVIADGSEQIDKLRSANVGCVRRYVQMSGETGGVSARDDVISFADLLTLGDEVVESELHNRLARLEPTSLATLIYTSGTTGPPKAVMLSHENLMFTVEAASEAVGHVPDDQLISYLPLSHIAEQLMSIYIPITHGITVSFAQSFDLLGENLREVRPTVFVAVPRVWEKMEARIAAAASQSSPYLRRVGAWARRQGLEAATCVEQGRRPRFTYWVAKKLVFDKVRKKLGLDRTRHCVTAAAPIARSTLDFFFSLGLPLLEIYGMSECSGPATISRPDRFARGKAGPPLPGTEIKIADDGEICLRGGHVFMGYMNDEASTRAALDEEGWLHTGDIGEIDADGMLSVTDRKKDLLITAGGKNVAPQNIEALLKGIAGIAQACVVGDRRKYLTALLTVDRETAPLVARECGSAIADAEQLHNDMAFREHVQRRIDRINSELARFETIKAFTLLPTDLSVERNELTPTMKMKRNVIVQRYHREIEAMYPEEAAGAA